MEPRLKYGQLAPEGLARMTALEHYLNADSGLDKSLMDLVRLLVSLWNGCEYCIHLHTAELHKLHETAERIEGLASWRGSALYTARERAALGWAEALTNIQQGHAPDAVYNEVRAHFTDVETVHLTLVITTINAWNRLAIALGAHSHRQGSRSLSEPPVRFREHGGSLEPLPLAAERAPVLRAIGLSKTYSTGRGALELFRELDLTIWQGEMLAIVGASGSGKSSLLHLLAALDTPTAGDVWCGERRLSSLTKRLAADFRNSDIGYVWQFHYLLPEFTALENVAMPLLARGVKRTIAMAHAAVWLKEVGLADRAEHRSGELSGGEQQRVSLARALVTEPKVLLADEPTGDLDGRTAEAVFDLIRRLHAAYGLTSVLVTHNVEFAGRCDRMLRLHDGKLSNDASH